MTAAAWAQAEDNWVVFYRLGAGRTSSTITQSHGMLPSLLPSRSSPITTSQVVMSTLNLYLGDRPSPTGRSGEERTEPTEKRQTAGAIIGADDMRCIPDPIRKPPSHPRNLKQLP